MSSSGDRAPRWAALDGVRALAVIGVMLYHAGVRWIPGGLLGVDVFFVLSGFLITSLLLREVRGGGGVNLGAFWVRRARRLLPALLLVLLAVMLWASLDPTQDLGSIRLDVASALGYVANWRFAFSHQGYFASTQTPSPVLHLWSLGVEEQFYLFWPLLFGGAVWLSRRFRRVVDLNTGVHTVRSGRLAVFILAVLGAAASTTVLVIGSLNGTDPSRLYYGTDTRALALMTGAALAAIYPLQRSPAAARPSVRATRWWSLVGAIALGALIGIVATVSGQDWLLYRGGFLVVALLVALLIAALTRAPIGPISRLLGLPPFAHIGRISYGLYLWHWPIILFLTADRTGLTGASLLWTRLGAALLAAEISYWAVERPILSGALPGRRLAVAGLVSVVAVAAAAGPWVAVPREDGSGGRAAFASKLDSLAKRQAERSTALTKQPARTVPKKVSEAPTLADTPEKLPGGAPAIQPNPVPAEPINVLLVGDSTAFSAGLSLENLAYAWRVNLVDASRVGCGIAPGVGAGDGDQAPVKYGECWDWPQLWQQTVAVQRPDISLLVVGHWEVVNRKIGNQVMHVGQPVYDNLLKGQFEKAVSVLGSQGGKVALATAPCYLRPERPDGTRWPQDDCARVRAFNRIVWSVAAEHPSNVVVLDLYQFFSPDGQWHLNIDGHQVRDPDGIHFNIYGGQYLAPVFLGGLRTLLGLPEIPQGPQPPLKLTAATGG